jgi:hypothetical protein
LTKELPRLELLGQVKLETRRGRWTAYLAPPKRLITEEAQGDNDKQLERLRSAVTQIWLEVQRIQRTGTGTGEPKAQQGSSKNSVTNPEASEEVKIEEIVSKPIMNQVEKPVTAVAGTGGPILTGCRCFCNKELTEICSHVDETAQNPMESHHKIEASMAQSQPLAEDIPVVIPEGSANVAEESDVKEEEQQPTTFEAGLEQMALNANNNQDKDIALFEASGDSGGDSEGDDTEPAQQQYNSDGKVKAVEDNFNVSSFSRNNGEENDVDADLQIIYIQQANRVQSAPSEVNDHQIKNEGIQMVGSGRSSEEFAPNAVQDLLDTRMEKIPSIVKVVTEANSSEPGVNIAVSNNISKPALGELSAADTSPAVNVSAAQNMTEADSKSEPVSASAASYLNNESDQLLSNRTLEEKVLLDGNEIPTVADNSTKPSVMSNETLAQNVPGIDNGTTKNYSAAGNITQENSTDPLKLTNVTLVFPKKTYKTIHAYETVSVTRRGRKFTFSPTSKFFRKRPKLSSGARKFHAATGTGFGTNLSILYDSDGGNTKFNGGFSSLFAASDRSVRSILNFIPKLTEMQERERAEEKAIRDTLERVTRLGKKVNIVLMKEFYCFLKVKGIVSQKFAMLLFVPLES